MFIAQKGHGGRMKKKVKAKKKASKKPRLEFNWEKFDAILRFKPTKQICSDIMEVSEDVIERRIREKYDCTFSEYRSRRMGPTRIKIAEKLIEMALQGNVPCLIYASKVFLGWSDKPSEENHQEVANVVLNIPTNNRE